MIFQLKNITFGYSPDKYVLENISLLLEEGKIYALVGNNGAGKTTLFNLITGFIKPVRGEYFYNEINLINKPPYKISKNGISRTFQEMRLITKLTVKENIILSMKNNHTDHLFYAMLPECLHRNINQELNLKAKIIIKHFFLNEVINSLASEISYGQQKLLSLACCVANDASLILLDEPVAGIQPEYCKMITFLIKQLKNNGKTILLIEHNMDFIANTADVFLFLNEGELRTFDTFENLKSNLLLANLN